MIYWLYDVLKNAGGFFAGFPFSLLDQVEFRALLAALCSFAIVVAAGKHVIAVLIRAKIGDSGMSDAEALRQHAASKQNTPTMGGILICAAIVLCSFLLADIRQMLVVLAIIVVVWLAGVGGADDWLKLTAGWRGGRQGLRAWEKLAFQLGLGLIVGFFAYRTGDSAAAQDMAHVLNLPLQRTYVPNSGGVPENWLFYLPMPAYVVLATLMIAGMSNAVNITDGMDGLAAGTGAVVAFGLMLLAFIAGDDNIAKVYLRVPYIPYAGELAVVAGALAGACVGFLWWNAIPARVFMGDTGSLAIGGLIAYLALATRQEIVTLVMTGVFLAEIGSVVIQVGYFKATKGKRVFRCAPYHHHLQMGGWPESRIVIRLWIVTVLLTIAGLATLKIR